MSDASAKVSAMARLAEMAGEALSWLAPSQIQERSTQRRLDRRSTRFLEMARGEGEDEASVAELAATIERMRDRHGADGVGFEIEWARLRERMFRWALGDGGQGSEHSPTLRALLKDGFSAQSMVCETAGSKSVPAWVAAIEWKKAPADALFALLGEQEIREARRVSDGPFIPSSFLAPTGRGQNPLMMALAAGRDDLARRLEPLFNPKEQDALGWTALMMAAMSGEAAAIGRLAKTNDIEARDKDGMTAWLHAARCGREGALLALAPSARQDAQDNQERDALTLAIMAGSPACVKILYRGGADSARARKTVADVAQALASKGPGARVRPELAREAMEANHAIRELIELTDCAASASARPATAEPAAAKRAARL
jgi:ankyrin repeat protein